MIFTTGSALPNRPGISRPTTSVAEGSAVIQLEAKPRTAPARTTPISPRRPIMQQFLFTQGTTSLSDDRDSSMDGDVVLHEFGHGVSNRLVGGPANTACLGGTQAGAMGEGWSDYWAATFFNDGRIGDYVT